VHIKGNKIYYNQNKYLFKNKIRGLLKNLCDLLVKRKLLKNTELKHRLSYKFPYFYNRHVNIMLISCNIIYYSLLT